MQYRGRSGVSAKGRRGRFRPRLWHFAPFFYPGLCLFSYWQTGEWHPFLNALKAMAVIAIMIVTDHDGSVRRLRNRIRRRRPPRD